MKRFLAFLMAALMSLSILAACANDTPAVDGTDDTTAGDTTAAETTTAVTETDRSQAKDNIPADLTLNGKTIGVTMRTSFREKDFDGGGVSSEDVLNEAMYKRTSKVADRLKVNFKVDNAIEAYKDFSKSLESTILAGDDVWQIVLASGNASLDIGNDYLFADLTSNKYIDIDQPWWWGDAIREVSLDGKQVRHLFGEALLSNYMRTGVLYFNKELYNTVFKEDDLYATVMDGKWTVDKLREQIEKLYVDTNGDGQVNDGDRYGLLTDTKQFVIHFEFAADIRRSSRDAEGYPVMDYDLERAQTAVTKLNALFYETKGAGYKNVSTATPDMFPNGDTVFFAGRLIHAISNFRDMEADFGIIPLPKLDDSQTEYKTLLHNSAANITVPITTKNLDEVGAVLEALASESYRSVTEVFLNSALKGKYSRDAASGKCIDIIMKSSGQPFLYARNSYIKGGNMVADQVVAHKDDLASAYATQKPATDAKIKEMVEKYIKVSSEQGK